MPIHAFTPGVQIPFGIMPNEPVPVDSLSGPYVHSDGTTGGGISLALDTIAPGLRFLSMEVRVLARPGGVTQAYKYWFRGNTATLEEFSSGGSVSGNDFPTGISANGATFNGLVRAYAGISVNGGATFSGTVTATTFSGSLSGTATQVSNNLSAGHLLTGGPFNGSGAVTLNSTGASLGANTFSGVQSSNLGFSGPLTGNVTGNVTGTATQVSNNLSAGHLLSGGPFNGSGAVTLNSTGASLGANTFNGLQTSATGFSGPLTGNVTGNVTGTATQVSNSLSAGHLLTGGPFNGSGAVTLNSTGASLGANTFSGVQSSTSGFSGPLNGNATTATNATNASQLGGTAASGWAQLGAANTFTALNAFNLGLTSAASYFSGNVTVGPNGTVLNSNGDVTIGRTLTVNGNMYIDGTLTTVNRVDLEIDDAFIVLGRTLNTDLLLNNAGIWLGVSGSSQDATSRYLRWQNSELAWQSSNNFNVPSGGGYEVNGVSVLATNQVHGLSFSSSATISAGTWQGGVIGLAYGGTNKNLSAVGVSGGIVFKDGTGFGILGSTGSASQILIGSADGTPAWANLTALTGLTADRVSVQDSSSSAGTFFLTFVDATSGAVQMRADTGITYSATGNILSCTQIEAIVDGGVWT